jgi:hypothetical protein
MTQIEFNKAAKDILEAFKRTADEAAVRLQYREQYGVIFNKGYTVAPFVYRRKLKRSKRIRHLKTA